MDNEKLVEIILKRVLEELSKISNDKNSIKKEEKKTVVFLGEDEFLKNELQKEINVIEKYNIKNSFEEIIKENTILEKEKQIIISTLCINNLINIAQGKRNLVTDYLLNGGEVYLIEEGLQYKKYSEPKQLIKEYDEYVNKLKNYGIKLVRREEIIQKFKRKDEIYIDGVITQKKLMDLKVENKKLLLKKESKITSLAQDYIKQNNIEVLYERG